MIFLGFMLDSPTYNKHEQLAYRYQRVQAFTEKTEAKQLGGLNMPFRGKHGRSDG